MMDEHKVKTKEDFINFIHELRSDLEANPENWENSELSFYFEAMAAWVESMEQCYINNGRPIPKNISWNVFCDILAAASVYE